MEPLISAILAAVSDPAAWVGLLTLIVLEIVLGIDNLVFIAILAEKVPAKQRDKARKIGLGLALAMRLGLLCAMSRLVALTEPLIVVAGQPFSLRDLIMLVGGAFLVFKATVELHERLEGRSHEAAKGPKAAFWAVVAQIVVLDAVFSLDAVITAVGMVEHLWVMMAAVVIAMGAMLLAARALTAFVNAHPTIVVLCLSFLLMIGFSLVAEGFGLHIPKGYLYAAIGFSILIETFNQISWRAKAKEERLIPMRERAANAILGLVGGSSRQDEEELDEDGVPTREGAGAAESASDEEPAFVDEERFMITGVLSLAERSIRTVMTPRVDVSWIDCEKEPAEAKRLMLENPHSLLPICRGSLDEVVGVLRSKDIFKAISDGRDLAEAAKACPPIVVSDRIDLIKLLGVLRKAKGSLVMVVDEFGSIQGLVTPLDILEAIAGEFPDADETPDIVSDGDGSWIVKGAADLLSLEQTLGFQGLAPEGAECATVAGLFLELSGHMPNIGDRAESSGYVFSVLETSGTRIELLKVGLASDEPEESGSED